VEHLAYRDPSASARPAQAHAIARDDPRAPAILYDEPTTGLDRSLPEFDALVKGRRPTRHHASRRLSRRAFCLRYRDRWIMLHEGEVRFLGTFKELEQTADPVLRGFIEGRPEGGTD